MTYRPVGGWVDRGEWHGETMGVKLPSVGKRVKATVSLVHRKLKSCQIVATRSHTHVQEHIHPLLAAPRPSWLGGKL